MAKEMILLADVEGLGVQGDVVRVKDGHARNYLVPKGLAATVNEANRRKLQKLRLQREAELAAQLGDARKLADAIGRVSCTLAVKTGQDDKLFGAVTSQHIADYLKKQGVDIDRHKVNLEEPIKALGVFQVPIRLHPELTVSLKVWVVKE
ncbi:MAG: 50S ribosomal protein L9 [Kiritimatiellia bacterium]|nr:50S ribosomal protein L9 [Kiritimatiellia bacterium]